jgi:4-amino-4-deoxy-L-arabinose transferase-like glycosyltransferase
MPTLAAPIISTGERQSRWVMAWYFFGTLLAVFVYFYALDSDHIPKNGDEYPYAHITRLTAQSGHLLPLQSELVRMRNTKPPLLFWQGVYSTHWGKDWTLWRLRYPSVIYTLLTGGMVFLLGRKLGGTWDTAFLSLLAFLAFLSTYRYGRPFLTNPPEVFWLFLPFSILLYWLPKAFESRLLVPVAMGLATGIGLLYKSFALVVPVSLALAWWYWHHRRYHLSSFLWRDSWKVAIAACLALGVFCLWFVLDPDPGAIIKEFVLGENLKKFDPKGPSYLATLLWGGSSIWSLALGYPLDAGLLALPLFALGYIGFKRRRELTEPEKLLWIWIATLFIVFSLPSQRDERYLLSGMPAFAVLCGLNWRRINRSVFVVSLAAAGAVVLLLCYLSWRLQQALAGAQVYPVGHWLLLVALLGLIGLALFVPRVTASVFNIVALLCFLAFAAFTRPLDHGLGVYNQDTQDYVRGKEVWIPTNFNAKEEGHRFFLPGANLHPYSIYEKGADLAALGKEYPIFAIIQPVAAPLPAYGRVIGQRLDLGSRHTSAQILAMLKGKVFENLFIKEVLVEAPAPTVDLAAPPGEAAKSQ